MDYLTVEDIFGGGLLILHVPHQGHAIGLMGSFLVVVVRGDQEFRVLMAEKDKSFKINVCVRVCVCARSHPSTSSSSTIIIRRTLHKDFPRPYTSTD